MQMSKSQQLRDEWGDKPCGHPDFDKEYYLGADTGDKVCTTCGKVLSISEVEEIKNRQKRIV